MDASSPEVLLMQTTPLRILVVLPMYGGSLPIGRYCANALRDMGHSVRVFDAPQLYSAFTGLRNLDLPPAKLAPLENAYLQVVSQAILTQVECFEPHLILALAQAPINRNLLLKLRQMGVKTAMWFVEDHKIFTYWRAYAPLYDIFAVIQKEPFISELAQIGQKNALYLPLAALPAFHKPQTLDDEELKTYGADISFLGAGYPNRRLAFRPLAEKNFKIWGSDWDDEKYLAGNIQRNGARVSEEESIKIYNATKININLHSGIDASKLVSQGDFVNPRTFELAAIGVFQLVDRRELMDELYAPGELSTFDTIHEMYSAIDHFLGHPEECRAMAALARERTLKDHTYQKRMQALLDFAEKCFGRWLSSPKEENMDANPFLKEKLMNLTAKLELGPNAGFEDVVSTLRKKNGKLTEMETCVLFLDEWGKQYK